MNKKIKTYFEGKGFETNGNIGKGKLHGHEVSLYVEILNNLVPVQLHIAFYASTEVKREILNEIRNLKIKYLRFDCDSYGLWLGMNDITVGGLMKKMDNILEQIFGVLSKYAVLGYGYCPLCGEVIDIENSKQYRLNWAHITLDQKCVENVNAIINDENAEFNAASNNLGKGSLGAVLGSLIGVVSYVILFFMNFISAISAFLSSYLGALFYKKFGGKPNKMMIVIVSVISIASMLLTAYLLHALAAKGILLEAGYDMGMNDAFKAMMDDPDFSSAFLSNFGLTALFSIIGAASQLSALIRSTKRAETIK